MHAKHTGQLGTQTAPEVRQLHLKATNFCASPTVLTNKHSQTCKDLKVGTHITRLFAPWNCTITLAVAALHGH